jgi:hypothetical protein
MKTYPLDENRNNQMNDLANAIINNYFGGELVSTSIRRYC